MTVIPPRYRHSQIKQKIKEVHLEFFGGRDLLNMVLSKSEKFT